MVHMLDRKHVKFHFNNKCLEYGRFYFYFSYGAVNKERMHEGETKTLNYSIIASILFNMILSC